uniref:Uncharacterized protein n=1 Tax=Anguilla anguilla TaxID=7936 RepID=A0A0E9SQG7_ANGAN
MINVPCAVSGVKKTLHHSHTTRIMPTAHQTNLGSPDKPYQEEPENIQLRPKI